jgi:hypothetical protein
MRGNTAKSKKLLFEGRSIVLNILFIAMNVFGAAFLLQSFFVDAQPSLVLNLAGITMFLGSTVMLFILKGFYMYAYFARLVIAVVFLISGFSKLNDPIGFAQILEQYFQDGALSLKMSQNFGWTDYSLEQYTSWSLKIAVTLALAEILLALMLLYHMLYKVAVFILLPFVFVLTYVGYYSSTCDSNQMFEHQFSVQASDSRAADLIAMSSKEDNIRLLEEKNGYLHFSEYKPIMCVSNCICLGSNTNNFLGFELTQETAFARNLMLLMFAIVLMITQFWLLPNSPFENTLFGISAWLILLIHGIITGWFWLIFLSGLVLHLSINVKRFGLQILKTSIGALILVGLILGGIVYYVISFEPLSDFRSYAVGESLLNPVQNTVEQKTKVYVYQHKFNNRLVYLSDESRTQSPVVSDSNYVFVREKEIDANPFETKSSYGFRPQISVDEIQEKSIDHPLVRPFLEKYSEELYRVFNKSNGQSLMLYANEFSSELYKDTNLVIDKFIGIHENHEAFDLGPVLISSDLVFIWVVKDIDEIKEEYWDIIRRLTFKILEKEFDIVVVGHQASSKWNKSSDLTSNELLYLNLDLLELNQICRSNVCLMVLKNGVIAAKYPLRGLPKFETIRSKLRLE